MAPPGRSPSRRPAGPPLIVLEYHAHRCPPSDPRLAATDTGWRSLATRSRPPAQPGTRGGRPVWAWRPARPGERRGEPAEGVGASLPSAVHGPPPGQVCPRRVRRRGRSRGRRARYSLGAAAGSWACLPVRPAKRLYRLRTGNGRILPSAIVIEAQSAARARFTTTCPATRRSAALGRRRSTTSTSASAGAGVGVGRTFRRRGRPGASRRPATPRSQSPAPSRRARTTWLTHSFRIGSAA